MILNESKISELLQKPLNRESITRGAKLQADHKIHITGEGYLSRVQLVEGYESQTDYENVKRQVAKPATILITSTIIDNLNRWTSAQGTVKKADFRNPEKDKQFQEILNKVWNGKSYEDFVNSFQKEAIYTEFNGFVGVTKPQIKVDAMGQGFAISEGIEKKIEVDAEGNSTKPLDPYMIFISISDIHDYFLTGDKVEYLIIRLEKNKKYRVIDDAFDRIVTIDGKTYSENKIPNELGYVPFRKVTNINEKILNNQVKTSPINHLLPALDRYFSCDADLRMQFIRHNYPKLAIVVTPCTTCGGNAQLGQYGSGYVYEDEVKLKCRDCDGTGKRIPVSRAGVIGIPQYLKQGDTAYPGSPASYVTPETESLKLAVEDLQKQKESILYAGTGDKSLVSEDIRTATENMINSRSLEDRISEISTMIEEFEVFIKKAIKDSHKDFASIEDYEISVKYGKKITLKDEASILKEIQEAKKAGMNFTYIHSLQTDLIFARYKNNTTELERQLLLNDIEPFAGYTIDELMKLEKYIEDRDLQLKVNFESLVDQFESSQPVQMFMVGSEYKARVTAIKEKLYEFLPKEEPEEPIEPIVEPILE